MYGYRASVRNAVLFMMEDATIMRGAMLSATFTLSEDFVLIIEAEEE